MIGLFKHNPETDDYVRVSGHLLTLVGYHTGARKDVLIVNDSASYKEEGANNEHLRVEPIETGNLKYGDTAFSAKGFLKVVGGQEVNYAADGDYDTIIITGATRLER